MLIRKQKQKKIKKNNIYYIYICIRDGNEYRNLILEYWHEFFIEQAYDCLMYGSIDFTVNLPYVMLVKHT